MFKNYFTVAIRNIFKYKVFSFINVFGLAVAMSVCMLIILMLADQSRYDAFHAKKDRIYRILTNTYATSPYPLASTLRSTYPVVEDATNLTPGIGGDATYQQKIADMRGYFAEPNFFDVFSFELEKGDKKTALTQSHSMVISRRIARQLFNTENPLGKVIEFSDRQLHFPIRSDMEGAAPVPWGSFTVTGVIDESKYKSHLQFDVLVSHSSRQALYAEKKLEDFTDRWDWYFRTYTYAVLRENAAIQDLQLALNDVTKRKVVPLKLEHTRDFQLIPQALGDVQLGLKGNDTNNRLPSFGYYFLGILAAVIMLSACVNYTNLSIARALTRAKEIGIRKVAGAFRKNLIIQFLSESIVTSLAALSIAVLLLTLLAPAFKGLWVNQYLNFELPTSFTVYLYFAGFALTIGVAAGTYPAFYLSKYQPIKVLKNFHDERPGKLGARRALGVFQFVISLFFITTSILIYNQFKHFMNFDYGFQSSHIVNVRLQGVDHQKAADAFQSVSGVTEISACDIIPSTGTSNNTQIKKSGDADYREIGVLNTDEHFASNLKLTLLAGRFLPPAEKSATPYILVNEAAVKKLGYSSPQEIVGETLESKWGNQSFVVAGVVNDFRYKLLINAHEIEPLLMCNNPSTFKYLNVRLSSNDAATSLTAMGDVWKKIDPVHSFSYQFFDDELQSTHRGIFDAVSVIGFISFLAIVIACLGLLGMATYTAERKTKEVGIRKILGADVSSIAYLLSKSFAWMLIAAVVIGAPLSYFVNNLWLQKFPNRVEFGIGTVMIGVFALLVLGLITITSQTIRVAKVNPVKSLKAE